MVIDTIKPRRRLSFSSQLCVAQRCTPDTITIQVKKGSQSYHAAPILY